MFAGDDVNLALLNVGPANDCRKRDGVAEEHFELEGAATAVVEVGVGVADNRRVKLVKVRHWKVWGDGVGVDVEDAKDLDGVEATMAVRAFDVLVDAAGVVAHDLVVAGEVASVHAGSSVVKSANKDKVVGAVRNRNAEEG